MVCLVLKLLLSQVILCMCVIYLSIYFVAAVIDPVGSVSGVMGISDGLLCLQWIL